MKNLYIIILLTFGLGQDYSLQFDGDDDYVDVGDPSSGILDVGDGDFSIAFYLNVSSQVNYSMTGSIICKRFYSTGNGYEIYGVCHRPSER